MVAAGDLHGIMAMMPAFTTPDGDDVHAAATVDVDTLTSTVDKIIKDGINVLTTTGSFGEFHTLLPEEFETLAHATVEAAAKRVPVFIGCTSLHTREALRKIAVAQDAGADGVLVGVPFYFPSTVDNAVRFYRDIAADFPSLGIMIYHNPTFHNITLPVDAFERISQIPNVVGMKDSHRDPLAFQKLQRIVKGKISVFVNQHQYYPYGMLGAAGCWSFDVFMGPWPILRLRDAVEAGDVATAQEIIFAITAGGGGAHDLHWRESTGKLAQRLAGYCDPGPLRPPFLEVPDSVKANAQRKAAQWTALCERYRPAAVGAGS